ncbi:Cold shock-like protein CspJ [Salinivirga cyanobacteriivorans]|uniref:Cold shock-like protein CspJ n=1 Tax=Salinivirga cyanobacteriivorans TaxID=1307839 RepID=A0A0S2HW68_9BACT|nr:cold shock domain-containing protein [Salinivirga cyanobacteriivorans]ALO14274.1 Cold shock-like protein CspJ [Salinivirga cyanobacteriivorans]
MGRSRETYNKKEVRTKKEKKRKAKAQRREERKENAGKTSLDDMIAYVDENGNLSDTPPDPSEKTEVDPNDIDISIPKNEDLPEEELLRKGVVTFYNDDKGFGFIKDKQSNASVFFHVKNTKEPVKENNIVTFQTEKGPKGPVAIDVEVIR